MRLVFGLAENIDFQSPIMTTAKKFLIMDMLITWNAMG